MSPSKPYSRSFKAKVLAAAGIRVAAQDDPFCTCGYCEDGREFAEEQFQAIMASAMSDDDGDYAAEESAYQALRVSGRNREYKQPTVSVATPEDVDPLGR